MIGLTGTRERSSAGARSAFDVAENAAVFAVPDEFMLPDGLVDASDGVIVVAADCAAASAFAFATADPPAFVDDVLFAFAAAFDAGVGAPTAITDTEPDKPLATYAVLPSGLTTTPIGPQPTVIVLATVSLPPTLEDRVPDTLILFWLGVAAVVFAFTDAIPIVVNTAAAVVTITALTIPTRRFLANTLTNTHSRRTPPRRDLPTSLTLNKQDRY
ncbi:MAG: hypothetical protein B5766_06060 [Candidatus Lumbricidophila eiseniae]|uniref:Uncharacterized protein n=1 Tax=Candidatus Lumbricidiphila eiseniae TaxID=1969409 RepID=A0A2A6FRS4_9MICO|nr:MAG: hypothetical protein B5766_06060 [Candidatus Lumbricidophila eiseniae]